jgi:hypothetical protein
MHMNDQGAEPKPQPQDPRELYQSVPAAYVDAVTAISLDFGEFILEQVDFFEQQLNEIRDAHEKDPYEALARKDRLMRSMLQRIKNEIRKLQRKPLPLEPRGADNASEVRALLAKFLILLMIVVEKLEEMQKLMPGAAPVTRG